MKEDIKKRGLSPIIASVLLLLLILVLASIIFFWARGFIEEQIEKFGEPIEGSCSNVHFEVASVGNELEVLNKGDIAIRYLEVRMSKEGESRVKRFDFPVDPGLFESYPFSFSMSDELPIVAPSETIVYPALVGNVVGEGFNSVYVCLDSGVTL